MTELATLATGSDADARALIAQVGRRVRQARREKGIARRVLSDSSGVSPRYLAQLEAGEGNISIGLLQRVAKALDRQVGWFVAGDDVSDPNARLVADLFVAADPDTRADVLRALQRAAPQAGRGHRICLVGLRGAGKSTLGRAAGAQLGIPFVELNQEIEEQGGMPIAEIMALYGQEGYRKLEADAVMRMAESHDRVILAVAGGIVAEPATYDILLARFHTIWVRASAQEHMDRVRAQGDTRPMAGNPEAMAQLRAILASRESHYARAVAQLDTSGAAVETSVAQLLALIEDRKLLK
ncbi:MAG: helix-turn-helix transcriptional regulator [Rhodobacter sp.]|nr:helix-turn-helix transcriptional regulator [Rhodobacter sp.]